MTDPSHHRMFDHAADRDELLSGSESFTDIDDFDLDFDEDFEAEMVGEYEPPEDYEVPWEEPACVQSVVDKLDD